MSERALADAVHDRRLVLFAGSGFSRDAGLPDWITLVSGLASTLLSKGLLSSELHAACVALMSAGNPPGALTLILEQVERRVVVAEIRELLQPKTESKVVASAANWKLKGVITTNFDRVVEDAVARGAYRLNNSQSQLKLVPTAVGSKSSFLWKVHGDIDDELDPSDPRVAQGGGFLVLTRADFTALIQGDRGQQLISSFLTILHAHPVLFVGYSLTDPDIRWVLDLLERNCQFSHPSWFLCLKSASPERLPPNVKALPLLEDWGELPDWMASVTAMAKSAGGRPAISAHEASQVERAAYLTISRYLTDLQTPQLTERVLASALFDELVMHRSTPLTDLAGRVAALLGVGPQLAASLTEAMVEYLVGLAVAVRHEGRVVIQRKSAEDLASRAQGDWERDRSAFFGSVRTRFAAASIDWPEDLDGPLEETLIGLCSELGESMAQWVSAGVGRDVGWPDFHPEIAIHFQDPERRRHVDALMRAVLTNPSDREVPYLYRLLGSTFLANTVRLNPVAVATLREALGLYELYLDANVLLPLVVKEHPNHKTTKAVVEETRRAGVRLLALRPIFREVRSHRELARRDILELGGDDAQLRQLAGALGMRANVFLKGYLAAASTGDIGQRVEWRSYFHRYSDQQIQASVEAEGIEIVDPVPEATEGTLFASALTAIRNEWLKKLGHERDDILNANEAIQMSHIYLRRRVASERRNHIWFLSNETVLQKVFERDASKWKLPATFPYSAWIAFLDSRLAFGATDASAVVKAILKGQPEAFQLPSPIALVRTRAFGERITSAEEEEALQLAMSDFALMRKVEDAQRAVQRRGRRKGRPGELAAVTQEAVGEIESALDQQIGRLREQLAAKEQRIRELERDTTQKAEPKQQRASRHTKARRPPN